MDDIVAAANKDRIDATGKFAYLDAQADLGTMLEVVEPPTSLGEPLRRLSVCPHSLRLPIFQGR